MVNCTAQELDMVSYLLQYQGYVLMLSHLDLYLFLIQQWSVTSRVVWTLLYFLERPSVSVSSGNRDANNTQINHLHHLWVHMYFQELFVFPPTVS